MLNKVTIHTKFKNVEFFESLFSLYTDNIVAFEIEGQEIDPLDDDIWAIEGFFQHNIDESFRNTIIESAKLNTIDISHIELSKVENINYRYEMEPINTKKFHISVTGLSSKQEIQNQISQTQKSQTNSSQIVASQEHIYISATRAFGTGDHPSTQGCIELLEYLEENSLLKGSSNILDMGTGSGILSIVASKLWKTSTITAAEIDHFAMQAAIENFHENKVLQNINFIISDGYTHNALESRKFNLIISNILAKPLISMSKNARKHLTTEGYIVLAGFLDSQAESVKEAYEKEGLKLLKSTCMKGWTSLLLQHH